MAVTYYVALSFLRTEDGTAPGEAQECQSEAAAIRPHTFLREIPQCWLTGQAAGVAAALAAGTGKRPRDIAVSAIQRELLRQGVYLSPTIEAAIQPASAAE